MGIYSKPQRTRHRENGTSHEQEVQDNKRKIRLLDPSYIGKFVEEYKSLIKESII